MPVVSDVNANVPDLRWQCVGQPATRNCPETNARIAAPAHTHPALIVPRTFNCDETQDMPARIWILYVSKTVNFIDMFLFQ